VHNGLRYYAISDLPFKWLFMPSDWTVVLSSLPEAHFKHFMDAGSPQPELPTEMLALIKPLQFKSFWCVCSMQHGLKNAIAKRLASARAQDATALAGYLQTSIWLRSWVETTFQAGDIHVGLATLDEAVAARLESTARSTLRDGTPELIECFLDRGLAKKYAAGLQVYRDGMSVSSSSPFLGTAEAPQLLEKLAALYVPLDFIPPDELDG
jgi:hypothetical protein